MRRKLTPEYFLANIDSFAYVVVVACVTIIILFFAVDLIKKTKKKRAVNLKQAPLEKAHGIIFGFKGRKVVYSSSKEQAHVLVAAGTGRGKTSTAIVSLRQWGLPSCSEISTSKNTHNRPERTMFVIDISGDVSSNCPDVSNKLVYEPENDFTAPYNIFATVDSLNSIEEKNEALTMLSAVLMPEKPVMDDSARFYLVNGRKILTAALIAFYHQGYDFVEICDIIMENSWKTLLQKIYQTENLSSQKLILAFEDASTAHNAGCVQAACDAISLFSTNYKVHNSLRRPREGEIAMEPKMLETHNLFMVLEDSKTDILPPLMRLISADIARYTLSRKAKKDSPVILLYWDEFGSLNLDAQTVVLPIFRRGRKHKVRVMVLMQNIIDMDILYDHKVTRAILSNIQYFMLLTGIQDVETLKYMSEKIGYEDTKRKSITKSKHSVSSTETEDRRFILEPADIDKQGKDTVILIAPDEPSGMLLLKKCSYYDL